MSVSMLTAMVSTGWQVSAAGATPSDDNPEVSAPVAVGDVTAIGVDDATPAGIAPVAVQPIGEAPAVNEDAPGDQPTAPEAAQPAAETPAPEQPAQPAPAPVVEPESTPATQDAPTAQAPADVAGVPAPSTPQAPVAPQASVVPVTPSAPVQATSPGTTSPTSSVPVVSAPDVPSTCAVPAPKAGKQYVSMTQWAYQLTNGKGQPLADNAKVKAGDKIEYTFTIRVDRLGVVKALGVSGVDLDQPMTCADTSVGVHGMTQCTGVHTITKAEASAHGTTSTACVQGMHARDKAWSQGSDNLSMNVDFAAKSGAQVPVAVAAPSAKASALPKPIVTAAPQPTDTASVAPIPEESTAPAQETVTPIDETTPAEAPVTIQGDSMIHPITGGLATLLGAGQGVDPGTGIISPIVAPGGIVEPISSDPGSDGFMGIMPLANTADGLTKQCLMVNWRPVTQCWPPAEGDTVRIWIDVSVDKSQSGCSASKNFKLDGTVLSPDGDASKDIPLDTRYIQTGTNVNMPCALIGTNGEGGNDNALPKNGNIVSCYVDYTVTDPTAGVANLEFTAYGTGANSDSFSSNGVSYNYTLDLTGLKLAKTATLSADNSTITYDYTVTNNGKAPVNGVRIIEDDFGGTGDPLDIDYCGDPATVLQVGGTATCAVTYAVTQQDAINGIVTNTAHATATTMQVTTTEGTVCSPRPVVSNDATADKNIPPDPRISLDKQADPDTLSSDGTLPDIGQTMGYTFTITNTGNVPLTGVGVDELAGFTGDSSKFVLDGTCSYSSTNANHNTGTAANHSLVLDPMESAVCTAMYVVQASDFDHGSVDNSAQASGYHNTTKVTGDGHESVPATAVPHITLKKSVSPDTDVAAGVKVTYSFLMTNDGNVTLTNVGVAENDAAFTGHGTDFAWDSPCAYATDNPTHKDTGIKGSLVLAPGESATCTATYTVTQADVDEGSVGNEATASGTPPTGPAVTDADAAKVTITADPEISLKKSASPTATSVSRAGDSVTYSFLIKNEGNVTLHDVGVDETAFSGDKDNFTWGSLCTYTVSNPTHTGTGTRGSLVLAPGESVTCTATYAVTQKDVDDGVVDNTAEASGTSPKNVTVTDTSTAEVTIDPDPSISLTKSVEPDEVSGAGESVTYSFVMLNDGNVSLHGVKVVETTFTGTGTDFTWGLCTYASGNTVNKGTGAHDALALAPGESATCTATYTVTQADADEGVVDNLATASGMSPKNVTVTDTSTAEVTIKPDPKISLLKSVEPKIVSGAGESVTYSFLISNDGNVTLHNVGVVEDVAAFTGHGTDFAWGASCAYADSNSVNKDTGAKGSLTLAPGESVTCTATYTVTQADADAGSVDNTAEASGTSPKDVTVTDTDETTVTITARPELTVTKEVSSATASKAGDHVSYTFTVENTGNVQLTDVNFNDGKVDAQTWVDGTIGFTGSGTWSGPEVCKDAANATVTLPIATLMPGDKVTCTASYTVTQPDVDRGVVHNTTTASGKDKHDDTVTSDPATSDVTIGAKPELTVTKGVTPKSASAAGDVVEYLFSVENTGNVTVDGVEFSDLPVAFDDWSALT
ncbi:MAG: hypothetical protein FWD75_11480, partial [Propionibacteriaceae bacterium]|nr:hypothetical protein [Propionibacteriaceae bacterium]